MSYDQEKAAWCESLALPRPEGIALVLDDMNPALARVIDTVEVDVLGEARDNPAVWTPPNLILRFGLSTIQNLQICILGAMLNALHDAWKVNGHATVYCTPPTVDVPFSILEIEVPVLPGRQRIKMHPSNADWRPFSDNPTNLEPPV